MIKHFGILVYLKTAMSRNVRATWGSTLSQVDVHRILIQIE